MLTNLQKALLPLLILPVAVAHGSPFSGRPDEIKTPDPSSLKAGLAVQSSGDSSGAKQKSVDFRGEFRSVIETDRYGLSVDWATSGEMDTKQQIDTHVHIRGTLFPSWLSKIDPDTRANHCHPGLSLGFSLEDSSHFSKSSAPKDTISRAGYEIAANFLCRSQETRNLFSTGVRFVNLGPDSQGSPQHLDELIAEAFLIAEHVDHQGRRLAGKVTVDTFSLTQDRERQVLPAENTLGLLSLEATGSIPIYTDEDSIPRVFLGLETKVFNAPTSSSIRENGRKTSWQGGLSLSAGY